MLADIKTFEAFKTTGMGVCSAMTWQNDVKVTKVEWYQADDMIAQLELLLQRFTIGHFKIGLMPDEATLLTVCRYIRKKTKRAFILWDPVLASSSGFSFFNEKIDRERVLEHLDLITPNWDEGSKLLENRDQITAISQTTTVYLKGGHREDRPGRDLLFHKGMIYPLNPKSKRIFLKHGSGCVFSSALCASLARGYPLLKACLKSKRYIESYLGSSENLLGYHKM